MPPPVRFHPPFHLSCASAPGENLRQNCQKATRPDPSAGMMTPKGPFETTCSTPKRSPEHACLPRAHLESHSSTIGFLLAYPRERSVCLPQNLTTYILFPSGGIHHNLSHFPLPFSIYRFSISQFSSHATATAIFTLSWVAKDLVLCEFWSLGVPL
jgi:hypothetical protein